MSSTKKRIHIDLELSNRLEWMRQFEYRHFLYAEDVPTSTEYIESKLKQWVDDHQRYAIRDRRVRLLVDFKSPQALGETAPPPAIPAGTVLIVKHFRGGSGRVWTEDGRSAALRWPDLGTKWELVED